MAKKLQIKADFHEGFLLYSIVSPLADYRISYIINQCAHLNLKKYDNLPRVKGGETHYFSWYYFFDERINTIYYLIANKSKGYFLIPELRQLDYFLLVNSTLSDSIFDDKIKLVRNLQQVYAVLKQDFNRLQNMDEFLERIEMHELAQVVLPAKHSRYKRLKPNRL